MELAQEPAPGRQASAVAEGVRPPNPQAPLGLLIAEPLAGATGQLGCQLGAGAAVDLSGEKGHGCSCGVSTFREQQVGELLGIYVVDTGQAGFDGAGHLAGQEAHGVEGVVGDLFGEQGFAAAELLIVDHRHHPALVGVDEIAKLQFGIVEVEGHGLRRARVVAVCPRLGRMAAMNASSLQASLFDFAIGELVRQHRESFQPLWSTESWAKLMIWLSLNCGCSTDRDGLEAFAAALGPVISGRMRRVFFERALEDLELQVLADPAQEQVLVMPMGPGGPLDSARVSQALERVGLLPGLVAPQERWQPLDALVAIPWGQQP